VSSWLGLAVPAATTRAIIARLNGEIRSILEMPDVRQRLADLSGVPTPQVPEEMTRRHQSSAMHSTRASSAMSRSTERDCIVPGL